MDEFNTPMMKQYQKIKSEYQDCLLFYRMGDFYELFLEDAKIGAQVLNITLTSRPKGKDGRIPMAGVPYHAVDSYLAKLVQSGFKVAICEQMSQPNKSGIIDREVIRIITPGTVLDEKALNQKENNYLIALQIKDDLLSLSACDLSTGIFFSIEKNSPNLEQDLKDELLKLAPSECLLPEELYNNPQILKILKSQKGLNISPFANWQDTDESKRELKNHFQIKTLASFNLENKSLAPQTANALISYLKQTQKSPLSHIKKIVFLESADFLQLDRSTMINLELFSTIREHDVKGSLLNVIDQTTTPMGARLLKSWICQPLVDKKQIEKRLDAVEILTTNLKLNERLEESLKSITDIERVLSRLSVNLGNARDLLNLKNNLVNILNVKKTIPSKKTNLLTQTADQISLKLEKVIDLIEKEITDEPPLILREGNLIKSGVNKELDDLKAIVFDSKNWILELETQEREKTGISSLKVRFNKVFGFYIEVSKSNLGSVPDYYFRKQTLVNGERFITPSLKEKEEIILTAEEKINQIEYELYYQILEKVLTYTNLIQEAARAVAILDCLSNFAKVALSENYHRPKFLYSGEIKITQGRHPVVEKLLDDRQFVPNNLGMNNISTQMMLITGPNMAGKSVYIRQIALICLMAQMGSFVPAKSAQLSILDKIFVRSGASDVITSGLSTFMVEMVETAFILNHATPSSLIVMDEIGRGTSTYDGISIAWAVAQYLVENYKKAPKTLFATHYHELMELEKLYPKKIQNFQMAVENIDGQPIFLHTIKKGGASHSFGLAVAKMAGIPEAVLENAGQILRNLEKRDVQLPAPILEEKTPQSVINQPVLSDTSTLSLIDYLVIKELENLDISQMTPLQALNKLSEIKEKIKIFQAEGKKFIQAD